MLPCEMWAAAGRIRASLFIDADEAQINAAAEVGAVYRNPYRPLRQRRNRRNRQKSLARIASAVTLAARLGLKVNAVMA